MILYRFCSRAEFEALLEGKTLYNFTDHFDGGKGGSTSRGFCFTADPPEVAWQYLKGIVCPEVCVEYNVDICYVSKSRGKYVGKVTETPQGTMIEPMYKDEHCMTRLSKMWAWPVKVIPMSRFEDAVTLNSIRSYYYTSRRNKQKNYGCY